MICFLFILCSKYSFINLYSENTFFILTGVFADVGFIAKFADIIQLTLYENEIILSLAALTSACVPGFGLEVPGRRALWGSVRTLQIQLLLYLYIVGCYLFKLNGAFGYLYSSRGNPEEITAFMQFF